MVNITYGLLVPQSFPNGSFIPNAYTVWETGTDMIVTLKDGTMAAYSPGDIAWLLTCTCLVWLMIPGIGYLYSGLVRRKNALTLLLLALLAMAVISFQFFFMGYSLAFSPTGGPFLGDMKYFGLKGVLEQPVPQANNRVPEIVYMIYQSMFACLVNGVFIGAAAERGRIGPALIFMFCWTTVVYCPIVHWIWAPEGWAFKLGVLDYAGGGPIEICSGVTGMVYSIYLGKRRGYGTEQVLFRPSSSSHIYLGTTFLWLGWLGFNGGSTFAANLKAALAIVNTNLAACMGGIAWVLLDYRLERKWSAIGFCTGAICGLVAITPAAGYVGAPGAIFIGIVASVISNIMTALKSFLRFDDAMDIYACHGVAGIVGLIFTGVFCQASVTANDGFSVIPGGWVVDHNWIQMGYQFAYICAVFGWTFVVSYLLMFIIDHIPYCHFRVETEGEILGTDEDQCGEYTYDYISLRRDVEWTSPPEASTPQSEKNQHPEKNAADSQDSTLGPQHVLVDSGSSYQA